MPTSTNVTMARTRKDDIERLSRGKSTRARIGSRGTPHRLTKRERILLEAAQRQGFLKVPIKGIRPNVLDIYGLWCQAEGLELVIKRILEL